MTERTDSEPGHFRDLASRAIGSHVYLPISRNPLIAVPMALYTAMLLISLDFIVSITPVQEVPPPGSEGIHTIGIVVSSGIIGLWVLLNYNYRWLFLAGVPWVRIRWVCIPLIYTIIGFLSSQSYSIPFISALVLHGSLLAGVYEVYSHSVLPTAALKLDYNSSVSYLETHLSNWWRITQIVLTGGLGLIIGLATNYYLSVQQTASITLLISFIMPIAIALLLLILYFLLKMKAVERQIAKSNSNRRISS